MVVDENKCEVLSCQCHGCAASAGGCKHVVAFLMWVHRRSEEPACTSIECYWRKSALSRVGTTLKYITVDQLSKKRAQQPESQSGLLLEFLQDAKKRKIENCELLRYQKDFKFGDVRQFSLHHLLVQQDAEVRGDIDKVLDLMRENLDETSLASIEKSTRKQHMSKLWHELRYARITASKAHEASHCKTEDGSLVAAIMGAKTPDIYAMKRGRQLDASIRKTVESILKKKFRLCGVFISRECPMIAATPDGITKDVILEIKCPTTRKTRLNYIKGKKITEKYLAQVQLQMYVSKKKGCYFCVAHEDFESSKNVDIKLIPFDEQYVCDLLNNLASFWKTNIYPLLLHSVN